MANKHTELNFPNRQFSAKVKNIGNARMKLGCAAVVSYEANPTCLCVRGISPGDTATDFKKVLGPVDFTSIDPGSMGTVRIKGRHTSILVFGYVSAGDWLGPRGFVGNGEWIRYTTGSGYACVIASETNTINNDVATITGMVVNWRV